MDVPKTVKELTDLLDTRYKLAVDCDKEMDMIRKENVKIVVDIELIKQTVKAIKWVATTTLAAVIAAIVGLIITKIA